VFIRGSKIRYIILPDMLKNAPMFKKQQVAKMVRACFPQFHLATVC